MEAFLDEKQAEAILREKCLDATLKDYILYMVASDVKEISAEYIFNGCMLNLTFELSEVSDNQ